ncbi:MAG: hypothetical protein ACI9Y1_000212, partial [Lentisphaeria bacterium]
MPWPQVKSPLPVSRFKLEQRHIRIITRRFWGSVFTLVILVAVLVQLGRQAFPLIKDYREEISQLLAQKIGIEIEVRDVVAKWDGLRPKLDLSDVKVMSDDGSAVFKISRATAELSIIDSIIQRRWAWRELVFEGFETTLQQQPHGGWVVRGMPKSKRHKPASEEKFIIDDPYDIFLFGRRVKITQAKFTMLFHSGNQSQVLVPRISLENDAQFHRILADVDVDEGEQAFKLIVEGNGDPRSKNFVANGYLELKHFSAEKVLDALGGIIPSNIDFSDKTSPQNNEIYNENDDQEQRAQNHLDIKLWFRGSPAKGMTFRGEVASTALILDAYPKLDLPISVTTQFTGRAHQKNGWALSFNKLQADWPHRVSPPIALALYGGGGGSTGLRIQEFDIATWVELALFVGLNNEKVEKAIKTLNLRGKIKNLDLQIASKKAGYFRARAYLEKGENDAYLGAPGFKNVNGYLDANALRGRFDMDVKDGVSVSLPKVYNDLLYFEQADGQVGWEIHPDKKIAYITSGLLTVTNPEEQGKGYMYFSLPFNKMVGEPKMALAIGIKNTLAKNHKKYVPKTIPIHLYKWLDASVKQGRVTNAKFLYYGAVNKDPEIKPTIQLYGEVHEGNLVFDPSWPELEGVTGRLWLENKDLVVRIDKATLLGNSVYDAQITLVDNVAAETGRSLSVRGSVAGNAQSAMTLLKSSPIKRHIGSTFDQWQVSGGLDAKVELLIPLDVNAVGLSHKIDVVFGQTDLLMPDLNLEVNNISGTLNYSTDKGIFSDNLTGSVWGESVTSTISSPPNAHGGLDTAIGFNGLMSVASLLEWTKRPELRFTSGKTSVKGQLYIPASKSSSEPLEVSVKSTLEGVAIKLPRPFAKTTTEKLDFESRIRFYPNGEEYRFTIKDKILIALLNDHNEHLSGVINFNANSEEKNLDESVLASGRFDVSGQLNAFDLEQWMSVKDQYFKYNEELRGSSNANETSIPVDLDVKISRFLMGALEIKDLAVTGVRQTNQWLLNVESELMSGKIIVPEDGSELTLDLDYLHLAADEAEDPGETSPQKYSRENLPPLQESVLIDLDLSRAVALKFSAKEFSLGDKNYGKWQFNLHPIENGIVIDNIHADVRGMVVGKGERGAKFVWKKNGDEHLSQFSGIIQSDNLANVFEACGQEKIIESDSAVINI